ncbi:MAG: hypothetical protein J0L88_12560 [Xanthomonadales bacterium]|nr:hypothetical protein [Xanthomonadales bacterium]
MNAPTNELLLALRAPTSGWLAAVICALDEALLDHDFSPTHRQLLRNLLDAGEVPASVSNAAQERLQRFEEAVQTLHEALIGNPDPGVDAGTARSHLTLCA